MPLEFYRILHLVGIFILLFSLGGACLHMMNGGTRNFPHRKWIAMSHGIALLLILVAGFGMLAKLGLMASMPAWVFAKLAIWLVLGGIPALVYRKPQWAKGFWFGILVLACVAAALGVAHT